jgi:hypothetical protein
MTGIFDWSKTAAANASADSEINWSEGQPRNTINDSARVMMRRVRQFLDDTQGALVTAGGAGTPNAYTVTTQSQITAYRTGVGFLVRIHQANTEAATLAVDGLAAKPWRDESGSNFQAGDLALDNFLPVYYHAGSDTLRSQVNASRSNPHGGCVLEYTNSTTITLRPMEDGYLRVNGVAKRVPVGGVTATSTGKQIPLTTTNRVVSGSVATVTLAAAHSFVVGQRINVTPDIGKVELQGPQVITAVTSTTISYAVGIASSASAADTASTVRGVWYVYAYDNAGAGTIDTLELSPTGHSTDAFGVETKTGDTSRVLVGMVAIDKSAGAPVFSNTDTRPWVRSYFNRSTSPSLMSFSGDTITGAGLNDVWTEIGTRLEPLLWAGETIRADVTGRYFASAPAALQVTWQFDNWNGVETPGSNTTAQVASSNYNFAKAIIKKGLSEGMHTLSVVGFKSSGTGTYYGHADVEILP